MKEIKFDITKYPWLTNMRGSYWYLNDACTPTAHNVIVVNVNRIHVVVNVKWTDVVVNVNWIDVVVNVNWINQIQIMKPNWTNIHTVQMRVYMLVKACIRFLVHNGPTLRIAALNCSTSPQWQQTRTVIIIGSAEASLNCRSPCCQLCNQSQNAKNEVISNLV